MRFTLVTATPATIPGGSGTYVATGRLQAGLEALGHTVSVVRPTGNFRWIPESTARRFLFNRLVVRRGAALESCDVIVGLDMDGWRLAGQTRRPFVAYLHGVIADEATFEQGAVRWLLERQAAAEGRSARRADLVLATSQYSRRRIAELYGVPETRIVIVPPGIDFAKWDAALAGTGNGERATVVLAVAHMYPRKNLAQLVRAAPLVLRGHPDVRFRVVGDGPERTRLERLARELGVAHAVRFLGHVSFDALVREYAGSAVFCLPSLQEGFGLVFAEAMAARKPVVALRASSTPELVRDGVEGLLVPQHDYIALADSISSLISDPEARRRMGAAGRARAQEFTVKHMAERFVEAVRPLAESAS